MPARPSATTSVTTAADLPGEAGPPPAPAPRQAAAAPAPADAASATAAEPPSREQLTMAWGDHILPKLRGMARALYSPGRFVECEGGSAVFALPANHPLHRCEPLRPEVEAALAGYFNRLVPMRLAIDEGQVARPPDQLAGLAEHLDRLGAGVGRARRSAVAHRAAGEGLPRRRDRRGRERGRDMSEEGSMSDDVPGLDSLLQQAMQLQEQLIAAQAEAQAAEVRGPRRRRRCARHHDGWRRSAAGAHRPSGRRPRRGGAAGGPHPGRAARRNLPGARAAGIGHWRPRRLGRRWAGSAASSLAWAGLGRRRRGWTRQRSAALAAPAALGHQPGQPATAERACLLPTPRRSRR